MQFLIRFDYYKIFNIILYAGYTELFLSRVAYIHLFKMYVHMTLMCEKCQKINNILHNMRLYWRVVSCDSNF